MKKRYIYYSLMCLLTVSCTIQESDTQTSPLTQNHSEDDVFYANLESYPSQDTRVSVDESVKLFWDAGDRISIFKKNTQNQPYQFSGEIGDRVGTFTRVSDPIDGDNELDSIYAIYPYQEATTVSDLGVITLTLPSHQTYKEGSFGPGANMMVSTTNDHFLDFKNLSGYLVLQFTGSGSIKSIRLEGNNSEPLSGEATVTSIMGSDPVINFASSAESSITLNCETPVELLGDTPTVFWMVVPPTSFTQGFTLTVTDPNGYVFFKETTRTDLSIVRNSVLRIAPIAVSFNASAISFTKNDISLVIPENKTFQYSVVDEDRTFTVTMPTITDFSNLTFNFGNKMVYADGKKIDNGETPINASKDVTLTIRNGQYGKNYTLKARNTGLPVVRITTEGFSQADITKDAWRGSSQPDENAWITVEYPDGKVYGKLNNYKMDIKGRGNVTWTYNKKPYALKFNKKADVLGMKESKHWVLLANWKDRTLLRNDATFWLSKQSGLPYTVSGEFVELEFNGIHRGNYYLCEKIRIEENRVNLTKIADDEVGTSDPYLITGPYIMEIDNNFDEEFKFRSGFYGNSYSGGLKYMFNDPDESISTAAQTYMKNYILNMEAFIKEIPSGNYGYRNFLDMDSAIWFMFVNELTGNGDFFNTDGNSTSTYYGPHSTFLYKDRDKADGTVSKLFMGPVWDFDYLTFYDKSGTRSSSWVGVTQQNYYYYYLTQDPLFRSRAKELWNAYKPIIETGMLDYIEDMKEYIQLSESFNASMWGYNGTDQQQNGDNNDTFENAVVKMDSAFVRKMRFMDRKINAGNFTNSN